MRGIAFLKKELVLFQLTCFEMGEYPIELFVCKLNDLFYMIPQDGAHKGTNLRN